MYKQSSCVDLNVKVYHKSKTSKFVLCLLHDFYSQHIHTEDHFSTVMIATRLLTLNIAMTYNTPISCQPKDVWFFV